MTAILLFASTAALDAQDRPRARDLGIPFDGNPGPLNAITDVAGVEVGHTTLIAGEGALVVGQGPVRTGVTVVFPRGRESRSGVAAGYHALNGVGEMTGTVLMDEIGAFFGPLALTNTVSVGSVHQGLLTWIRDWIPDPELRFEFSIPVVAETWDGGLNDIWGFHVRTEHVVAALEGARGGPVAEGSVGGGTGMVCHGLKGGIGTASRRLPPEAGGYTVGVLVQANHGTLDQLTIAGVPVGRELLDLRPRRPTAPDGDGSIIVVIATDAPLLPHQLQRVARRAGLGLARVGSTSGNGSGDIFVAFSTAHELELLNTAPEEWQALPFPAMDPLFRATVEATEEAVANALVAADTMSGADGLVVHGLPHERVREILRRHGRLAE